MLVVGTLLISTLECMCVYVCECIGIHLHVCGRDQPQVFLKHCLPCFFGILFCFVDLKQCLFTDSQLSTKLSWLVYEPQGMPITTSKMLWLHPACIL